MSASEYLRQKEKQKKQCTAPDKLLKEFIDRRMRRVHTEERILEKLLGDEDPNCVLFQLQRIKELFGDEISINGIIEESIKRAVKQEEYKATVPAGGFVVPEREAGILREHLHTMERAISEDMLNKKLDEGLHRTQELYENKPKMQELWQKRLYAQRDNVLKKLKR